MTANQITRKLTTAGIEATNLTIARDEVEVYVPDADGKCNRTATDRLKGKVVKALGFRGSYRCGHGGWVLQTVAAPDMGEFGYVGSRYHY